MIKEKIKNVDIESFGKKAFITFLILESIAISGKYAEPRINAFNNYKNIVSTQQATSADDVIDDNDYSITEYIANKNSKKEQLKIAVNTTSNNLNDIAKSTVSGIVSASVAAFYTTTSVLFAQEKFKYEEEEKNKKESQLER